LSSGYIVKRDGYSSTDDAFNKKTRLTKIVQPGHTD
jgi:hypothetical protein